MKIKLRNLRHLIRQTILEAPLADILPTHDYGGIDIKSDTIPKNINLDPKSYDRFHRTPLYRAKAESTFSNFSKPIYIIPVKVDGKSKSFFLRARTAILDADSGIKSLRENGFGEKIDLYDLQKKLNEGGTVFLNCGSLKSKFLPTPWMMVHAMFDSSDPFLGAEHYKIFDYVYEQDPIIKSASLVAMMTTASARNNEMTPQSDDDPIAELMTQEIVTKNGARFLESTPENWPPERSKRVKEKIEGLKVLIDSLNLKSKFEKKIEGKIIIVNTSVVA